MTWRRLADWCLPDGTFPRWLTAGDYGADLPVMVSAIINRRPLSDTEYAQLKGRYLAAQRAGRPTHIP